MSDVLQVQVPQSLQNLKHTFENFTFNFGINRNIKGPCIFVKTRRKKTRTSSRHPWSVSQIGISYLHDEEASDAFRESTFLAGQNHLQHVSVQLLHYNKHVLDSFEHALQQNHAGVRQILENTHVSKSPDRDYNTKNQPKICNTSIKCVELMRKQ